MARSSHPPRPRVDSSKRIGFWLGLLLFAGLLLLPPPESMMLVAREQFAAKIKSEAAGILLRDGHSDADPSSAAYQQMETRLIRAHARIMMGAAAVTALVACWWITVAVPIPVASLLPLVLFPLVGVLPVRDAAIPYGDVNVFFFMGGFIIALGVERWGLHRRIAMHIVLIVGAGRATLVLGFMIASAALSMWISNTATTMMMLPIGMAVVAALSELDGGMDRSEQGNFAAALMLGIAYASSIGGIATPIGTAPNIVFRGQLQSLFPQSPEISFGHWLMLFVPLLAVFIPVTWLVLIKVTCRFKAGRFPSAREVIRDQLRKLGRMSGPEAAMLIVFLATAALWMTRSLPLGENADYGWASLAERWLGGDDAGPRRFNAGFLSDATVAVGMAVLMFVIPAGRDAAVSRRYLMDWETAQRLPWGILLLFGGGFAIAEGFRDSGLSLWCGKVFAGLAVTEPILLIGCTCLLITFLTEITSNTATTQVMLPILAQVSRALGLNPLLLMLPATVSASCAFMLPVATPPNAIVFGSGHVSMGKMVRSGIILNFAGVVIVTLLIYFLARPILGIDLNTPPDWAAK